MRKLKKAQKGKTILPNMRNISDNTKIVTPRNLIFSTGQGADENLNEKVLAKKELDKKVVQKRKDAIKKSDSSKKLSKESFANSASGERFRFFPKSTGIGETFDDYFNPFKMVGDMADNIGHTYSDPNSTVGQKALTVGMPVAGGLLGGIGAKSTGQFVNNIANPFAGMGRETIDNLGNKYLPNAYKLNPYAFKPNSEAYYRVLGKEGANDALESGVIRANQKNIHPFSGEPIYDRPYFSKGTPLDRDWKSPFKNKKGKTSIGSIYPDETMVEVFGHNKFHQTNDLVTSPSQVLRPFDEGVNMYQRDWLKGYKQIDKPSIQSSQSITKDFVDWGDAIDRKVNPKFDARRYENSVKSPYVEPTVDPNLKTYIEPEFQQGGTITNTGYLPDSPDRHNPYNIIPSNNITMKKVPYPIMGYPNVGQPIQMMPGQDYNFPNADYVTEVPMMQRGGMINDLMPYPTYNMNNIYNPNTQDSIQYKYFFDNLYNKDPQYIKEKQMLDKYGSLVNPERMSKEEAVKRYREENLKKNAFKDVNPFLTTKQKNELYRPFELPNKQMGGVPNARKVDKVPEGYIPYSIPNYYHNPQSSKASGTANGPKMSDAAWKDFVSKNPDWNKSANTDDFVYIEPQQSVRQPTQPQPSEAFRGEPVQGYMSDGSRRLIGFINRPMKRTDDVNITEGMIDTSMEDATFVYAGAENSKMYGKPDISRGKYKFKNKDLQELFRTTDTFKDGRADLSPYKMEETVTANKMQDGGQHGLNLNGQSNFIDPNNFQPNYNFHNFAPSLSEDHQKNKNPFSLDPNLSGVLLNAIADWTQPTVNNRALSMRTGSSDAQFSSYQGNRGDWDSNTGQYRPNSYVPTQFGNTFMSNYGMPKAQLGMSFGDNSERMSLGMQSPEINPSVFQNNQMQAVPTEQPMMQPDLSYNNEEQGSVSLDSDFQDYAQKAQTYISQIKPDSLITGEMLAKGAQEAFEKTGKVVPLQLALAQLVQEGFLAKGTKNKPQRTLNPFNVGNTDNGSTVTFKNLQSGVNKYYNLISKSYLSKKTPEELLSNFTNNKNNRYATDPNYEKQLKKHIKRINDTIAKNYEMGGEYEMTEEDIQQFMKNGGQVEYL